MKFSIRFLLILTTLAATAAALFSIPEFGASLGLAYLILVVASANYLFHKRAELARCPSYLQVRWSLVAAIIAIKLSFVFPAWYMRFGFWSPPYSAFFVVLLIWAFMIIQIVKWHYNSDPNVGCRVVQLTMIWGTITMSVAAMFFGKYVGP